MISFKYKLIIFFTKTMSRIGKDSFADHRIKHMFHRLYGPPSISLSLSLATVVPGGEFNALALALIIFSIPRPNSHR